MPDQPLTTTSEIRYDGYPTVEQFRNDANRVLIEQGGVEVDLKALEVTDEEMEYIGTKGVFVANNVLFLAGGYSTNAELIEDSGNEVLAGFTSACLKLLVRYPDLKIAWYGQYPDAIKAIGHMINGKVVAITPFIEHPRVLPNIIELGMGTLIAKRFPEKAIAISRKKFSVELIAAIQSILPNNKIEPKMASIMRVLSKKNDPTKEA